ncbi:hypothetical protein GOBAR_AA36891 [Gossypium barbadense]|uniref:Piwi domain-containing protein n=1 Tax=Gossypium barbadense TaxID=3634 RepID=A0A2P5VYA7_GOSBA|nr:hypothetical protein GOBAR_AA36891 [Gossypium barbadense]
MEKASTEEALELPSLPLPLPTIPSNVKLESLKPPKYSIVSRSEVGTSGRKISLLANHFKVSVNAPDAVFYQYTVAHCLVVKPGVLLLMEALLRLARGQSVLSNVSTTMILRPGPVFEFLKQNLNLNDEHFWLKARRMLKNMRIKTIHSNMDFKITGLSEKPCCELYFPMKVKNGGCGEVRTVEITVYEYFTKHCGIELTYSADMPCLDVGKPKRPNYLPLELCSLVSLQRYTKALTTNQRATLVERSRQKPRERIQILTDALKNNKFNENLVLSACEISIGRQLTEVEGRILETPRLKVGNHEDCIPRNGRWNYNNKEMERPHTLIEEERHQAAKAGPAARVEAMFDQIIAKLPGPPEFILCVLPVRKNSDIYGMAFPVDFFSYLVSQLTFSMLYQGPWKKKCLCDMGIATQCISPGKINDQYLTNVLLKINSKLGGINSLLEIEKPSILPLLKDTPTLILGMDVSHGSPGRSDVPSIAAVVGSLHWPLISRYRASVRTQSPKMEMIEALYKPSPDGKVDDGIIRELLVDFYKTSGNRKPKQIIVFRDGVSESQFNQVLNIELEQIIKSYQFLGESDVPKFTVVVAQKNHHTKLFQANAPENVPPGTIVDTKIVHPRNYDFYMCAHAGMIGTSRPAHYHVLLDEIGFSPNDLQNLIHCLSYVYQRSTAAVSIVAPICYAHLAAYQMGQFLKLDEHSETSSGNVTSTGSILVPDLPRLKKNVASTMFFC